MAESKSFTKILKGIKPVSAGKSRTVQFGPECQLEGYMLEDGSFRQSIKSTADSLGMDHKNVQRALRRLAASTLADRLISGEGPDPRPIAPQGISVKNTPENGDLGQGRSDALVSLGSQENDLVEHQLRTMVLPVTSYGVNLAYTMDLQTVTELWWEIAVSESPYAEKAKSLLKIATAQTLESVYKEAWGVSDARSIEERLINWWTKLEAGKHTPLYGGLFHKHFHKITGVSFGHPYAKVCLAELIYHRIPEPVFKKLQELNPYEEGNIVNGRRVGTYSQYMSDDMKQEIKTMLHVVTSHMTCTPSRLENPNGYKELLKKLDKYYPRYKTRGKKKLTKVVDNTEQLDIA